MFDKPLLILVRRVVLPRTSPLMWFSRSFSSAKPSEHVPPDSGGSPATHQSTPEKLIKVAIIGVPNAGKSTLINHLIDHRVCPTSMKVHTTRSVSKAIQSRSNSQIILFDTPGLVGEREMKKHQLDAGFVSSCRHAIQNSHLVGVVHDVSNTWTRNALNPVLLEILKDHASIPSFLILNKIDTLKSKRILLDIVKNVTNNRLENIKNYSVRKRKGTHKEEEVSRKAPESEGWPHFLEIFMVSAMTGDGLKEIMSFVQSHAKAGSWEHLATEHTDQPPEELVVQSVRARLLDYLPQEIPYLLQTELEFYEKIKGKIFASAVVTCPSERLERLVCGEANGKLRQITERVTSDLTETFAGPVSLTIATRIKGREK